MQLRILHLLVISLLLLACSPRSNSNKTRTIYSVATLKGPSSMGMIKLIDSLNWATDPNIRVLILNEPIQVRKMMLDGSADFALLPTTMAAITYNKGLDYQLVGIPLWGTLSLVGTDSTIVRWEQLKGKRIHVMGRGMTPDEMLRFLLVRNGIDPESDVTLDYSFPTHIDLANAVAAGRVALGVLSEPMASQVLQERSNVRQIFDFNSEWHKVLGSPIAITAFMARRGVPDELVQQVASAYKFSTDWVNLHPDSAANLMVQYQVLPSSQVALRAIPRSNLKFVWARNIKDQVNSYLNVFYQMNPDIVGGKMPDEEFIY